MPDIVETPPAAVENRYKDIPDEKFLQIYGDAREQVEFLKAAFCIMEDELIRRGLERKATHVFGADGAQVEIKYTLEYEKRFDILDDLKKIPTISPAELEKALYTTTPEPERKADTTKLKAMAKKHGGEVAEIIARGLKSYPKGRPQIKFTPPTKPPEQINVTDSLDVNAEFDAACDHARKALAVQ